MNRPHGELPGCASLIGLFLLSMNFATLARRNRSSTLLSFGNQKLRCRSDGCRRVKESFAFSTTTGDSLTSVHVFYRRDCLLAALFFQSSWPRCTMLKP